MSLKVLFVSSLYPSPENPWAGMFHTPTFARLRDRCDIRIIRAQMTPVYRAAPPPTASEPGVTTVAASYIPKCGVLNGWLFARSLRETFFRLLDQEAADIVFTTWMYPDAYGVMLLCRERRIPYVCDAVGSDVNRFLEYPVRRRQVLTVAHQAKAIVARSSALKEKLVQAGIEPAKVTLLYNGVDHATFKPLDRAACRAKLGISQQEKWILFLGGFVPVKNLTTLLQAMRRLTSSPGQSVRLFLGGYGHLKDQLRQEAESLGISAAVRFSVEPVPRAEVPTWINAADVVCLPSLNEGIPNIILETMACGVPSVASRVGGIPEVLPESAGILVNNPTDANELANALTRALQHPWDRAAIQAKAGQYDWNRTADTLYQVLLNASRN